MSTRVQAGDRVAVPWGFDSLCGTVVSVYGPPGHPHVIVCVEFDDANSVECESISFPMDAVTVVEESYR
jgi:hypothetical protein